MAAPSRLPSPNAVSLTPGTRLSDAARALTRDARQTGAALRAKPVRVPGQKASVLVLYEPEHKPFSLQRLLAGWGFTWCLNRIRDKEAHADKVLGRLFGWQYPAGLPFPSQARPDRPARVGLSDLAAIVGAGEVLKQLNEAGIDWQTYAPPHRCGEDTAGPDGSASPAGRSSGLCPTRDRQEPGVRRARPGALAGAGGACVRVLVRSTAQRAGTLHRACLGLRSGRGGATAVPTTGSGGRIAAA